MKDCNTFKKDSEIICITTGVYYLFTCFSCAKKSCEIAGTLALMLFFVKECDYFMCKKFYNFL